ncbi:MAG: tRNA lysidine(34) synthetase TilS [Verrucomicrobia bacterium]|nr:tRNA lysidine(34) synthetase TilS [Verrucomicrobiota bacterium]
MQLKQFIDCHKRSDRPLLAAISGGADSLALLHALMALKIDCHVAHVDHGWRTESQEEAARLKKIVPYPFHLLELRGSCDENGARKARHNFFRELCHTQGCEAVLLAHHANDRAETVFKRMIEGAPIVHLSGPRPVEKLPGLTLWRPFLSLRKSELSHPFETVVVDSTNFDPRYHRGWLRTEIFPKFKRPFEHHLARLGSEAEEIRDYFDGQVELFLSQVKQGPFGTWLDLSQAQLPPVLLRHLLRRFCPRLSYEELHAAADFLGQGRSNAQVGPLVIDRGHLFLPHPPVILPQTAVPLSEGRFGTYTLVQGEQKGAEPKDKPGWQALWQGCASLAVPKGEWSICPPYPDRRLRERFNAHQVPAFLREQVPVLRSSQGQCLDWLTPLKEHVIEELLGVVSLMFS